MLLINSEIPSKWALNILLIFLYALVQFPIANGAAATFFSLDTTRQLNSSIYDYKLATPNNNQPPYQVQLSGEDNLLIMNKDNERTLNLTAITWAHAVNSRKELSDALEGEINMIEADIVLGQLNGTGLEKPVMAHPPANTSDISLEEFLNEIISYNFLHAENMKGVKLDFKSIEVFEGSLDILKDLMAVMIFPVWLNADIVRGPVNQNDTIPVDPERFFAGCANFTAAVLSIGWTTRWGPDYREESYTATQINEMLLNIQYNNVTETGQPITFPVRAGIAANSLDQLHHLVRSVNDTNESTLTIWSSNNDYVDIEKLRQLIFSFGLDRVYLDVPEEVSSKLDLGRSKASLSPLPSLMHFSVVSAFMLAASMWLQR